MLFTFLRGLAAFRFTLQCQTKPMILHNGMVKHAKEKPQTVEYLIKIKPTLRF